MVGGGAGGGGRGNSGNPGNAGNAGSSATPGSFACTPVTKAGSYPVTVGTPGGQITISWNAQ